jgi:hypothetical protein
MSVKEIKPQFYFYLFDGRVIKSKKELTEALKNMNDGVFFHHVNSNNNDFANWLRDVFKEKALAQKLVKCKTKDEVLACITGKKIKKKSKTPKIVKIQKVAAPVKQVKHHIQKQIIKQKHHINKHQVHPTLKKIIHSPSLTKNKVLSLIKQI